MYAVEFEATTHNGHIKIPEMYNFENNEKLRVIILKNDNSHYIKYKEEVSEQIKEYKQNGKKNFAPLDDGLDEIDSWLNNLQ